MRMRAFATILLLSIPAARAHADQVIPDDVIIQGSVCSGTPCANNHSFGFATAVLRSDTPQIVFEDTSQGAFPSNDWALVANDATNGGQSYFGIRDITANRTPFRVVAGAPSSALFVDASGRLGLGTSSPSMAVHMLGNNSPTVRLEQTGAGGFTPWTWDVGANEANFFVRDLTGGGRLPFRIKPGAPTNSIYVGASGKVGFGTSSPAGVLHLFSAPSAAGMLVIESSAAGDATVLKSTVSGDTYNVYVDVANAHTWVERYGADPQVSGGRAWLLGEEGSPTAIAVTHDGNMRIAGTLSMGSSRAIKHGIVAVDPSDVLQRVKALPLSRWQYKRDPAQSVHLGPMAEDFHRAFRLGEDDKHIAPSDLAGVAAAATQALAQEVDEQQRQLQKLEAEQSSLSARLEALEKRLQRGRR